MSEPDATGSPRPWRGRKDWVALLVLVVLVLLPRLVALAADPPRDLESNWIFDEGWWAHNARNVVLFGHWIRDQHNPAFFLTPLYSVTLALVYRVAGIGLAQTRLLSGVAGFLTCVVLYLALRRSRPTAEALVTALALGLSYPMLVMNRVGLTESFQLLFIVATIAAALEAVARPRWALVTGLAFGASMLSKPSALVIGFVVAAFWWIEAPEGNARPTMRARLSLLAPFAAGVGIMLVAYLLTVALPHWAELRRQLQATVTYGLHIDASTVDASFVGLGRFGLPVNWFFLRAAVPVVIAALLLGARAAGTALSRRDRIETICWLWLGMGLATSAALHFVPSRRFIFLLPPLVVLAVQAVLRGDLRWPGGESGVTKPLHGAVVIGLVAAFYAQPHLAPRVLHVLTRAGLGQLAVVAPFGAFVGATVVFAAALVVLWRHPPRRALILPAWIPILVFLVNDPGRFVTYAVHPTFSLRDANREIARMADNWPDEAQVMVGDAAASFAYRSRLRLISQWREGENVDAFERFPLASLLSAQVRGDPGLKLATEHGLVLCHDFDVWPDRAGRPWMRFQLFTTPTLCPPSAASPKAPASPDSATARTH